MKLIWISCIIIILSPLGGLGEYGAKRSRLGGTCKKGWKEEDFTLGRAAGLEMHNILRCMHNSPPMVLSDTANHIAQDWAEKQVEGLVQGHSKIPGFGENMWSESPLGPDSLPNLTEDMAAATRSWYSEIEYYVESDFQKDLGGATGHFTQAIWKESIILGMGAAMGTDTECTDAQYFMIVGEYDPPGNYQWQEAYDENIEAKPSRSKEFCTRVIRALSKRSPGVTFFHEKKQPSEQGVRTYATRSPGFSYVLQNTPIRRRKAGQYYVLQNHRT